MTLAVSLRLAIFASAASLAAAQPTVLLDAMSQELNRNFTVLKDKADPKPYFLSYEITELEYKTLSGTLGTIDSTGGGKDRQLDVSIRVGSPKLDNYHSVDGDRGRFTSGQLASFENTVNSIKRRIWLETDRAYRAAAERLIRIKTNYPGEGGRRRRLRRFLERAACPSSVENRRSSNSTRASGASACASSPRACQIIRACSPRTSRSADRPTSATS